MLGGIGVGVAVASRDTATTPAAVSGPAVVPARNIAQACGAWAATNPGDGNASMWCNSMTTWMNDQITGGRMTGTMMWSDPIRMLATCQTWTAATPPATYPSGWCQAMVDWMRDHATTGGWTPGMMPGWAGAMMTGRTTP